MEENKKKESLFRRMFITRTLGFINVSEKRHFWEDLAKEFNGTFKIKQTVAKDLDRLILQIPYKQYLIEFTESDAHPLKINCKLDANHKFEFSISYKDTIDKLLTLFGQQDIPVGDEIFDKKYLIQGKDSDLIKTILAKGEIKNILLSNNVFSYNGNYEKKDDSILLSSLVSRTINSKSELSELFKLFCLTIEEMNTLNIIK